ncbi:unnamed protein product [Sphacelaria rigidula]
MSSYDKDGKLVLEDPLQWWRVKAREYRMLAAPARRVLCIPESQAQSERVLRQRAKSQRRHVLGSTPNT